MKPSEVLGVRPDPGPGQPDKRSFQPERACKDPLMRSSAPSTRPLCCGSVTYQRDLQDQARTDRHCLDDSLGSKLDTPVKQRLAYGA